MWECLDTFYGNEEEKEVDRFLKFEAMPAVKVFNAATISILITALQGNWNLLQQHSGDSFLKENNIHLTKILKKIPLKEKDRFLDYCHYGSRKATFPVFKDWLTERWHRLKDSADQNKPDKGLVFWQNDIETSSTEFLQNVPETDVSLVDWNTVEIQSDEQGNSTLAIEAPQGDDLCFFVKKGDQVQKIRKATFGSPFQTRTGNRNPRTLTFGQPLVKKKDPKSPPVCAHCKKQGHYLNNCETYKTLSVKDRYKIVQECKLCIRCLSPGHIAKSCRVRFLCDIDGCGRRHHRLLHPDRVSKTMFQLYFRQGLDSDLDSDDEEDQDIN
jgi:hypothetical protein